MVFSAVVWAFVVSGELWQLLASTGIVARIVLAILLLASVFSWAVTLRKSRTYRRAQKQNEAFLRVFRQSRKLSEVRGSHRLYKESPLLGVFEKVYREIESQGVFTENPRKPSLAPSARMTISGSCFINQRIRRTPPAVVSPLTPALITLWGNQAEATFNCTLA